MLSGWEVSLIVLVVLFVLVTSAVVIYNVHPRLAATIRRCFGDTGEERTILTESDFLPRISSSSKTHMSHESSSKFVNLSNISRDTKVKGESKDAAYSNIVADSESDSSYSPIHTREKPKLKSSFEEDVVYAHTKKLKRGISTESQESDYIENIDATLKSPSIGELEFTVEYERAICELTIGINKCRGLIAFVDSMDFYVTAAVGDIKVPNPIQTKLVRGTPDPVFDERYPFHVEPGEVELATLIFEVHAISKSSEHKQIGCATVKVADIEIQHPVKLWVNLRGISEEAEHNLGDVLFSLSYLPTVGRLTIVIVKARNLSDELAKGDKPKALDPVVKVFLYEDGTRIRKKKTTVRKATLNPVFNEAMIFQVSPESLVGSEIRILAGFQDENGKMDLIGHLLVGPKSTGLELSHWNQMVDSPRKLVSMWHALKEP